jgi:endonuclease G, mitochondrial
LPSPWPAAATALPSGYDHDRFATLPHSLMTRTGSFVSSFETPEDDAADSPYKGIPKWVSYEMHALMDEDGEAIHPQGAKRPVKWYELDSTAFLWQGQKLKPGLDAAYRGFAVYWNRGHLAARNHANRISWQEGCNTHTFVNAVPQYADMNQGDWLALENYAIAAANKFGRVWTIAGPVFEPGRDVDTIGKEGTVPVAIPHALFKILVIERKGKVEARAFLFPQADAEDRGGYRKCAGTPQSRYDLALYSTSIATLEKATGLHFLTNLSETQRRTVNADSPHEPWTIEGKYWADRCGGEDDDDDA